MKLLFVLLGFLGLLAVLELALPRLVNLEAVQKTVFEELRRRIHCETEYRKIDFTLFPKPHAIVRDVRIWSPGLFDLSLKSMTLYPKLGPLFSGDLRIHEIAFLNPDIQITWPTASSEEESSTDNDAEGVGVGGRIARLLSLDGRMAAHLEFLRVAPIAPSLKVQGGRLAVMRDGKPFLTFHQVQARGERGPGRIELSLGGESSFCERISVQMGMDLDGGASSGQIIVAGARLHALGSSFLRGGPLRLGPSTSTFAVEYAYHQHKGIDLTVQGEVPELMMHKGDRTIRLAGARFDAGLILQGQTARLGLKSLVMETPRLRATGTVLYEGKGRDIQVEVEGREVSADEVREVALGLWGEEKSVRETFEVVTGGHVPYIRYGARGRTLEELKKLESTVIAGSMEGGRIYIPPVDLEVESARGEVEIAGGMLKAWNLQGRAGESQALDGVLTLALKKDASKDGPFHLDLQLEADLGGLPAVLGTVVKDAQFQDELARLHAIAGRAKGRLVLGERLKAVKTLVEAGEFEVSGRTDRVPYPIRLKGSGLRYEGRTLSAVALEGAVGQSVFEPLSIGLDWGMPSGVEVRSGNAIHIDLDEIYPWLTSHPSIRGALKRVSSLNGRVTLRETSLNGQLMNPSGWSYSVKADVEGASLGHDFFPDLIHVESGRLHLTTGQLLVSGCGSRLLDASLLVSGALAFQKGDMTSVDLSLTGGLASRAIEWGSDRAELPGDFRIRGPATLSNGRFSWHKDRRVGFSGAVSVNGGPRVELSLRAQPGELNISSLAVKDRESSATCTLLRKNGTIDLTFNGVLAGTTLDQLFLRNLVLEGSMKGSFQSTIRPDRPRSSTARGALEVQGLKMVWGARAPLEVRQAALRAEGGRLWVDASRLNLDPTEVTCRGFVDLSPEGFHVDMDVTADELVWERLVEFRQKRLGGSDSAQASEASSEKEGRGALSGSLRVKSGRFVWGDHGFAPAEFRVDLRPDGAVIDVSEARLCGISLPGRIEVSPQSVRASADLAAAAAPLGDSLRCLWGTEGLVDGTLELEGALSSAGPPDDLLASLQGRIDVKAREGRIFPIGFIGKVFSVLNITEIYRGQIPDLTNRGCAYDSITASGVIRDGILTLDNSVVDAHCMKMIWKGTVDLRARRADLVMVVAPLRTVDRIIDKVPILGDILNGSLLSFPVRVSGDLKDPDVVPLSPSALGAGLIDLLKRTIQTPTRLMEPLR
ncbi:MAG: AsmA-like C-terminal region-containing protein [Syntrophobacteraceae bacterium]|nr:AsmA-like C-terminal region-containing protein [Syntrophobacteraceae bacterium]